jgi:hypothetical protein
MSRRRSSGRSAPAPATTPRPGYGSAPTGDPFAGVERVFIDGSNLLHALARGSGSGSGAGAGVPAPAGAVIGRLRAAFPPSVIVDLVFDGPAVGGIKGRLATGLRVAYSGRFTADQVIDDGVRAQLDADGPAGTWGILVITDDRMLRESVASKGARTAGTAWLGGRIGRLPLDGPARDARSAGRTDGRTGGPSGGRRMRPVPLPKSGTTFGHRRPPLASAPDDE